MNVEYQTDNSKGNKFSKYLKPPYIYFILGGVALGLFAFFKKQSSNTTSGNAVEYYPANTDTSDTTSQNQLADTFNSVAQSINGLESSMASQNAAIQQSIASQNDSFTKALAQIAANEAATNQSIINQKTQSVSDATSSAAAAQTTNEQVAAAAKIAALQTEYKRIQDRDLASGATMTAAQQAELDDIHQQANDIGIAAGFGSGDSTGKGRNIPTNVQQITGVKN